MKRSPIWKKIVAIITLWLAVLVGGTLLVNLFNMFQPLGMRYQPGDLGWYVIGILSGPLGVWLGKQAMEKLTEDGEYVFRAVNYIVIAVFAVCVAVFSTAVAGLDLYYLLLEAAIAFVAGVEAYSEFEEMSKRNGHNS